MTTEPKRRRRTPVCSKELLASLSASLSALAEKWRTERDFLVTGEGADRMAAQLYDECAGELMEIVKANKIF
jgi:hypothetical protein